MRRAWLVLAALVGASACDEDTMRLEPTIELPAPGSEADPLPGLEEVELAVGLVGDSEDLVGKTFTRGQPLVLPGVPLADDLVVHLSGRAGGAEVAYGRTCALDLRSEPSAPAPRLYFARTVKWAAAATPPVAGHRTGGLAFAGPDGSAFFLDGTAAAGAPIAGVDHFDPREGAWQDFADVGARHGAVLATLGDGSALVVGGVDAAGAMADFYERLSPGAPAALQVERTVDPRLRLIEHAAATLADGAVVIIGGRSGDVAEGAEPVLSGAVWDLRAAAGGGLEPPHEISATLAVPRARHTLTRLSDDLGAPVLVVGGVDAAGAPVAAAELYKPLREAFADPTQFKAQLALPRSRHAAVRMPDGSVLVVGGVSAGGAVPTLELFSIDGGFQIAGDLPVGAGLVDFSATPLPDGRVLLAGGRLADGGPPLATAFIARLDPTDGSVDVVATDDLAIPRAGHQAVQLCDGTILLVGGTTDPLSPAERYNPPSLARR